MPKISLYLSSGINKLIIDRIVTPDNKLENIQDYFRYLVKKDLKEKNIAEVKYK